MANFLNRWEGIGRLGKDPEIRNIDNGNKVANLSLAVTQTFKDKQGEKKEVTEWVSLALWNGLATIAENHLKKGDQIYAAGKLCTRSWKKDGETKYITEIHAESIIMLGRNTRVSPRPEANGNRVSSSDDFQF